MSGYGESAMKDSYGRAEGSVMGQNIQGPGKLAGEAARPPETVRYLAELEKMLAICGGSLDTLEGRLERVVRQQAESIGRGETPVPREVAQTAMGGGIQLLLERATTINTRLMQLAQRIEV